MSPALYDRVKEGLLDHNPAVWKQRSDCTGKLGGSTDQKMTSALRMLAYGSSADSLEEYTRYSETSILEFVSHFSRGVIEKFGPEFLREPTDSDIQKILAVNEYRGFPGCLGSLDCMHWY